MVCQLAQTHQTQHNLSTIEFSKSPTKTYTGQLIHTKKKRLFKPAKPLFIGSIPIAASNNPSNSSNYSYNKIFGASPKGSMSAQGSVAAAELVAADGHACAACSAFSADTTPRPSAHPPHQSLASIQPTGQAHATPQSHTSQTVEYSS
jgi:hypothetical protein